MSGVVKVVAGYPAMSRQRSRSGEVVQVVATTPAMVRQRSRSGEPVQFVAPSGAMVRQRSRSGEFPPTSQTAPALQYVPPSELGSQTIGEVPATAPVLQYVPPSELGSQAMCRQRSRSVEVPVEVVSPQRTLPQVSLQYVPPEQIDDSRVDIFHKPDSVDDRSVDNQSARVARQATGPRVERSCEEVFVGAKKRFLDASSRPSSVADVQVATVASDVKPVSCDEASTWSAEELSAGSVKLRWQAGKFSVVDKQEKGECLEAAPEFRVRYFDGSVEVGGRDLAALRDLLANDLAVSIGDQPSTGLSGAVMIPGPEFFNISQGHTPASLDNTVSRQNFCFPVLLRHPGFEDTTSADEDDEKTTKVVVAKTKEDEAMEKASAAEQKALMAEAERDAACKQATAAEKERDAEKANVETAKSEVVEALAKVREAECKVVQAEKECNADHERALAAEKERDEEKMRAEAAKTKEEEAMAKATAAEQKAVEADAEREAAHQRAMAAEIERDAEKGKVDAAKFEVAEAMAMLFVAQQKIIQAEKERDAIKALTFAAKKRDEDVSTQAGSPELFDMSQGDTPANLHSPASRPTFCFPVPSDAAVQSADCLQSSDVASDSFVLADADTINIDKTAEKGAAVAAQSKSAECHEPVCTKEARVEDALSKKASKSSVMDFPEHLRSEAAFAHAYLPVDAYVKLVMSEFSSMKKTAKGSQQPTG